MSRETGVSASSVTRALKGKAITARNAEALAVLRRVPPRTRTAEDFARAPRVTPPQPRDVRMSWSIETIRGALEAQMRGRFADAVRLREAMTRDDAIFVARSNRTAPVTAVATALVAHDSARGRALCARARLSVQIPRTVLADLDETLVEHGVAIGYVEHEPNADGTAIDFRLTEWPLEHVEVDPQTQTLYTYAAEEPGARVPIVHGDGRWAVFRHRASKPWRKTACVLAAGFVWAAHAEGIADFSAGSRSHGLAKLLGELPEGVDVVDANGMLTPYAQRFLDTLQALVEGSANAAVRPAGSRTEWLASGASAWQIFLENIVSREKAAARIYLGTDAALGSVGGAPGVDIAKLFSIAASKLQGDFEALTEGLASGVYEPWAAINTGDSRYSPRFTFLLPDPDAYSKIEERAAARKRLTETIAGMKAQGLVVDQALIDTLAREYSVTPAPRLASADSVSSGLVLAPTDIAKVVRVREARASQGLAAFGDERDDMTITQLDAWTAAQAAAAAAPAP